MCRPWDQPAVVRNHEEVDNPTVFLLKMQKSAQERAAAVFLKVVAMGIVCDILCLRRGTRRTGMENKRGNARERAATV